MTPFRFLRGRRRAFARDRRGSAAVEFALSIGPFLFLLMGVFEIAYTFYLSAALDSATQDMARQIRTGVVQSSGLSTDEIAENVCTRIDTLTSCDGNVYVDAQVFSDFGSFAFTDPVTNGEIDPSLLQSDFGSRGDAVLMRVYFVWDSLVPDYLSAVDNMTGGRRLFVASAAFRNEPF